MSRLVHDEHCMSDNLIGPSQWVGGGDEWAVYAAQNEKVRWV